MIPRGGTETMEVLKERAFVKLIKKEKGLQLVQKESSSNGAALLLYQRQRHSKQKAKGPISSVANKSRDHVMVQRKSLRAKGGAMQTRQEEYHIQLDKIVCPFFLDCFTMNDVITIVVSAKFASTNEVGPACDRYRF